MVRRQMSAVFMAGAYVFPGGRVDAEDGTSATLGWCDGLRRAEANLPDLAPDEAVGYHIAALRELFEEAGILLARDRDGRIVSSADQDRADRLASSRPALRNGDLTLRAIVEDEHLWLALDTIQPCAHWVTPAIDPRRYDTRFYVARLPEGQAPAHDATETTESRWMTAAEAVERCRRDEIVLPVPTWSTLREIERLGSVDEVFELAHRRPIVRTQPRLHEEHGLKMLLLPGDPLNPDPLVGARPAETRFIHDGSHWRATTAP